MVEKTGCPVKYAVFKEKNKYKEEYIALQCEVEEINKRYLEDGKVEYSYKVSRKKLKSIVSNVYDSLNEADYIAKIKNQELTHDISPSINMDETYPSKYAILDLKYKGSFCIASKCNVIEEKTLFFNNESHTVYNVLFPYKDIKGFEDKLINENKICLGEKNSLRCTSSGNLRNVDKVAYVYDNFEEAQKASRNMNNNVLMSKLDFMLKAYGMNLIASGTYNEIIESETRKNRICYLYEEMIRREVDKVYLENDLNDILRNFDNKKLVLKK